MIQVPGTGWPNSIVGSQGVTTTFLFTQTSSWLVKVCLTLWWTPSLRHVHFHRQVFKSLFLHRKVPNNWSAVAVLPVQHSAWCPVVHDQRRCCRKWSLMRKSSEKSGKYQWPKIWQIWVIWIWEFGIWLTYHHHIIFIFSTCSSSSGLADHLHPAGQKTRAWFLSTTKLPRNLSVKKVCILEISNFAGHWWCTAFRIPCGTGMLVVHSVSYREILISHLHVLLGRKCIYPGTFILKASRCCMCTEHYWAASTIIAKTSCVVVRQPACMPGRDPLIAFNFVQRIQVPQHHLSKE